MTARLARSLALLAATQSCSDADTQGAGGGVTSAATTDASSSASGGGGAAPITDDFVAGGDRPVTVLVPDGYDPAVPAPLVVLLHGYGANGLVQDAYFGLAPVAEARGILYAHPDGNQDPQGNRFWNATDACCDFFGSGVDDVGYLVGLVDEIASKVSVDPKRVYFVGHSNGGFMSYRLACEAGDRIAAIISLAGATWLDPADCGAASPVSVAQIHGTMDDTVPYDGGPLGGGGTMIPSALDSVAYFANVAGCDAAIADTTTTYDLDSGIAGSETTVQSFGGCSAGYAAELWTIPGGAHIPALSDGYSDVLVDFLLAHPKP
jgi:polyhydroxybutyrate depolymerase